MKGRCNTQQTRRAFFRNSVVSLVSFGASSAKPSRRSASEKSGSSIFRLERGGQDFVVMKAQGIAGDIQFRWEGINVAYSGVKPSGVEMLMSDSKAAVLGRSSSLKTITNPAIHRRGPEIQLKLDREDEHTEWKRVSESRIELILIKPQVFRYESWIEARGETVTIESRLINQSSWDWRDAYVYFHWGLRNCPIFADYNGDRTVLFTTEGTRRVSELQRRLWHSTENPERYHVQPCKNEHGNCFLFRPTAQYYEPEGRSLPKVADGFKYDMCGISPNRINRGLSLRLAQKENQALVMTARRFRAIFVDMSDSPKGSQCVHVDPSAGDLPRGEAAVLRGSLFLVKGTLQEVTQEAIRRQDLTAN
jgi:hypothetical protein